MAKCKSKIQNIFYYACRRVLLEISDSTRKPVTHFGKGTNAMAQNVPLERWKVFDYVSYQKDVPTEHYRTLYNGNFCVLSEHWVCNK